MIVFETSEVNTLAELEYNSRFGFWQQAFQMYGYMKLTKDLKYKIHYIEGYPHLWQPHNSCAWTPLGVFEFNNIEIEPCKSKLNLEFCNDEFYNDLFRAFHEWNNSPQVGLSQAGQVAVSQLIESVMNNATEGSRLMLTAGKLFDLSSVVIEPGTATKLENAFRLTADTCRGWIQLCRQTGALVGHGYLDQSALFITSGVGQNISNDGTQFTGSVLTLYDNIRTNAKQALRTAIISGGVGANGRAFFPLFLCSGSIYERAYNEWLAMKATPIVNEMRLSSRSISAANQTVEVMFIDQNIPIIPVTDVDYYDRLLTGTSHFAYLTISGTIQLGTNFANIPEVRNGRVAIAIQQPTDLDKNEKTLFKAHQLTATALKDKEYIAGAYKYAIAA